MLLFLVLLYICALIFGAIFAAAIAHMVFMPNMFNTPEITHVNGLLWGVFDMLYRVTFYMVLLTAYEVALMFIEKRYFKTYAQR